MLYQKRFTVRAGQEVPRRPYGVAAVGGTRTDLKEEAKKFHDDPTTQPPLVDDESTVETLPMAYMNTSSVKCLIKLSRRAKP